MKKLKLKKSPKIFFDASISTNGKIGIGIYELNSNEKTIITIQNNLKLDSNFAEELALKKSLVFATSRFSNNHFMFFTDNISLYRKYRKTFDNFKSIQDKKIFISIHWIPRELNKEADKLSKLGSSDNIKNIKQTTKKINNIMKKTPLKNGLKKFILDKPFKDRVQFLKSIFKEEDEQKLINYFFFDKKISNNPINRKKNSIKKLKSFVITINSIFSNKDLQDLNKYKTLKNFIYRFKENSGNLKVYKDKELEKIIKTKATN